MNHWRKALLLCCFVFLLLTGGKAQQSGAGANYAATFTKSDLEGRWFLLKTSLHKWAKGKKNKVTYQFANQSQQGSAIEETISYTSSDRTMNEQARFYSLAVKEFSERMTGGMHVTGRHWYVVAMDPGKQWLIIYVGGTFFHKDAIQLLCRTPQLTHEAEMQISKLFEENYFLHAKTQKLHPIIQQ
jgi:hypothetical protein